MHIWLKQADRIPERKPKSRKAHNPTYPILPCKVVNEIQQLDLKGLFYLQGSSRKHYLAVLQDEISKKTALPTKKWPAFWIF